MFSRTRVALTALLLCSLSVGACADRPADPARVPEGADAELAVLRGRLVAVHGAVRATGAVTAEHRAELRSLVADVKAWQLRTGRDDIATVTRACPKSDASASEDRATASLFRRITSACGCPSAPDFEPLGQLCVLTAESCPPGQPGYCVYTCTRIVERPYLSAYLATY